MISDQLKFKIEQFKNTQSITFTSEEKKAFKEFCQETFRFSVDMSCRDCVCQYVNKVIVYLEL